MPRFLIGHPARQSRPRPLRIGPHPCVPPLRDARPRLRAEWLLRRPSAIAGRPFRPAAHRDRYGRHPCRIPPRSRRHPTAALPVRDNAAVALIAFGDFARGGGLRPPRFQCVVTAPPPAMHSICNGGRPMPLRGRVHAPRMHAGECVCAPSYMHGSANEKTPPQQQAGTGLGALPSRLRWQAHHTTTVCR